MSRKGAACVVLAAGLGTRMKSSIPKVLHPLSGRPLLSWALDGITALDPERIVVVVNAKDGGRVKETVGKTDGVRFAVQKEQKGTAHAVLAARPALKGFSGTVLVSNGDTPLVTASTLDAFLKEHKRRRRAVSMLSFMAEDPTGYGRIVRDPQNNPVAVIEEKDATPEQKAICEVNSGVYAIEPGAMALITKIPVNKKKGEFYLTDLVALAIAKKLPVGVFPIGIEEEFLGVNDREDLAYAAAVLKSIKNRLLMTEGVTLIDPSCAFIDPDVEIGPDTTIHPNVYIQGETIIGKGCAIMPGTRIVDSNIGDGVTIKDNCLIERSVIQSGSEVGPMAHLRPDCVIAKGAKIGNFVEIKKSFIGEGTKAMHLSYIGDASVGSKANIGAGTITCNYDGVNKHRTEIGDGVFIGSDTQLVAPVTIGEGAYVGAGSTITNDVESGALAVSRVKQTSYPGWAARKKRK